MTNLHDYLALGQVEAGLQQSNPDEEEIARLPLFLRLLTQARPLSSVPFRNKPPHADQLIDEAVARLEDRAAMYSSAETVQTVACHLAPAVCRKFLRKATPASLSSNAPSTSKRTDQLDEDSITEDEDMDEEQRQGESLSEDTLEYSVWKTLNELQNPDEITDDSLLAQPKGTAEADLGATVVSILHHAPKLKHRDVAVRVSLTFTALC